MEPTPEIITPETPARYNIALATIDQWKKDYQDLTISGPEDKIGHTTLRTARLFVRGKRLEIEKRTIELNDPLKLQIKQNNDAEKELLDLIDPLETTLHDREKAYDAEVKKQKEEKALEHQRMITSRVSFLLSHGCSFNGSSYSIEGVHILDAEISRMTEDQFIEKQQLVTLAFEIEQKRVADEKAAAEFAESERKRLLAEEKAELKKQQDALLAEKEKQRLAQAEIDAENKRVADDLKAERDKIELEKTAKSLEEKHEAERSAGLKLAMETAESDKKQAKIDAKLIETAKPDQEKLLTFSNSLSDIEYPDVKIESAVKIINEVKGLIVKVQSYINTNLVNLK